MEELGWKMPEQDLEENGRSQAGRLRDWILLASTVLGLLANVGLHFVYTNTQGSPTALLQTQAEEAVKTLGETKARLDVVERRLNEMHETQALMELQLKYEQDNKRR